jgi:hypothetical protein
MLAQRFLLTLRQESKLFDVVTSLADVMIIMPSLNYESHFNVGPRDLIHNLALVLSGFRGGNPAVLSVLQDKLSTLGLASGSPQKLLEYAAQEEERQEWHNRSSSVPSGCLYSSDVSPILLMSPKSSTAQSLDGND